MMDIAPRLEYDTSCEAAMKILTRDDTKYDEQYVTLADALEEIDALRSELGSKQAQIDRLMLEYCRDEMTPEQLAEWERNQVPARASCPHNGQCHPGFCPCSGNVGVER